MVEFGVEQLALSLGALGTLVALLLQFLLWAVPEVFRRFQNRNYSAPTMTVA